MNKDSVIQAKSLTNNKTIADLVETRSAIVLFMAAIVLFMFTAELLLLGTAAAAAGTITAIARALASNIADGEQDGGCKDEQHNDSGKVHDEKRIKLVQLTD